MNWKVTSFRGTQVDATSDWQPDQLRNTLFTQLGWPDSPNIQQARECFLVYDEDTPALKDSYRFPICNLQGGTPHAVGDGLRAAESALSALETELPAHVVAEARTVLEHYFSLGNSNERNTDSDAETGVIAYPARVIGRANGLLMGMEDAELLRLAKARAGDPAMLDEVQPYFWAAQISNSNVDAYFTRMMQSSLKNYAADSEAGIAFQQSHNTRELPMGGSLRGKYTGAGGNGVSRVETAFYTIPGLQPGQLSTDQLILMMRAGTVHDVSIGFYGGYERCNICGFNIMDWRNCMHWPGEWVDVPNKNGDTVERKQCVAEIEDAHLAEVSAVYDGACPGATITKARMVADAGLMKPEQARILEARYRIKLPGSRHVYNLNGGNNFGGQATMTDEERAAQEAANNNRAAEASAGAASGTTAPPPAATTTGTTGAEGERAVAPPAAVQPPATTAPNATEIRTLVVAGSLSEQSARSILDELDRLTRENTRLAPLADAGNAYRAQLIEDTVTEGKRAMGTAFPEETYRSTLALIPNVEGVRAILDGFKAQGNAQFPGGRQTVETSGAAASEGDVAGGNGSNNPENPTGDRAANNTEYVQADDSLFIS
jgi:hypothetical protein